MIARKLVIAGDDDEPFTQTLSGSSPLGRFATVFIASTFLVTIAGCAAIYVGPEASSTSNGSTEAGVSLPPEKLVFHCDQPANPLHGLTAETCRRFETTTRTVLHDESKTFAAFSHRRTPRRSPGS